MPAVNPPHDPSADISALRKMLEQAVQHAQMLVDRYEKNATLKECLLLLQKALASISEEDEIWPDPAVKIDWVAFGKTVKHRRKQAHLGQKELADLLDVSESMIRFIEGGQKRPSR